MRDDKVSFVHEFPNFPEMHNLEKYFSSFTEYACATARHIVMPTSGRAIYSTSLSIAGV